MEQSDVEKNRLGRGLFVVAQPAVGRYGQSRVFTRVDNEQRPQTHELRHLSHVLLACEHTLVVPVEFQSLSQAFLSFRHRRHEPIQLSSLLVSSVFQSAVGRISSQLDVHRSLRVRDRHARLVGYPFALLHAQDRSLLVRSHHDHRVRH